MARKPMTEEQKAKARENLAKARAARAAKNKNTPQNKQDKQADPVAPQVNPADYQELLDRIKELEQNNFFAQFQQMLGATNLAQPTLTGRGLVGTLEKYALDKDYYSNPVERLSDEARLKPFAFKENFELGYEVSTTSYETKDGRHVKEPKFTIELYRIMRDPDTGDDTGRRYTVCRGIFHEDPEAARVVAEDNGFALPEDAESERLFLDEMRYLRMRDWLLEAFFPPKPAQEKKNKREMVVDGKLVEVFEINSETTEAMPFNELKRFKF